MAEQTWGLVQARYHLLAEALRRKMLKLGQGDKVWVTRGWLCSVKLNERREDEGGGGGVAVMKVAYLM